MAEALKALIEDKDSALYKGEITSQLKQEVCEVETLPIPQLTEEEKKAKKDAEWQKTKKKFLTVARVVARSESRRLAKWVYENPTSLRALSFLCGFLLLVSSVYSLVMDLFSGQFSAFLISFWLIVLSLLLILSEAKIQALQSYVVGYVERYFQLLRYVSGRGYFMMFLGLLAMSLITKGEWQNSLDLGVGVLCVLVGMVQVVQGLISTSRSNAMRAKMGSEEVVRERFKLADVNANGSLDVEELGSLCMSLGSQMSSQQLECVLRSLDGDKNGSVDVEEFLVWWKGGSGNAEESAEGGGEADLESQMPTDQKKAAVLVAEKKEASKVAPTILRVVNVLLAVCVFLSGFVGAITVWSKDISSILVSFMDLWMMVFGIVMVWFESGSWCGGVVTGEGKAVAGFNSLVHGGVEKSAGMKV